MDSTKSNLVTAASMQMRVEILSYKSDCLRGVLYNLYLDAPYEFTCLVQMILKMERIFNSQGFPEASMTPRVFIPPNNAGEKPKAGGNSFIDNTMTSKTPAEPGVAKCTFEIDVKFRRNATWQGQIIWVERNLKQSFRSVLEMLKLMDEALNVNGAT